MFMIDMDQGRIIDDKEIKDSLCRTQKPYQEWLRTHQHQASTPVPKHRERNAAAPECAASLLDRQQAYGYTQEDIKFILEPMAKIG
jgi:glutamate synthase (NADPH/NADH) large chain